MSSNPVGSPHQAGLSVSIPMQSLENEHSSEVFPVLLAGKMAIFFHY